MPKKNFYHWVAYPQKIARVQIIRKGTGGRRLRNPVEKPVTIEDDNGDQFVVGDHQIFDDPIAATEASIKMAACLGVPPMVEVPHGDQDSDEDSEEDLDSGPDSDLEEEEDSPDSEDSDDEDEEE